MNTDDRRIQKVRQVAGAIGEVAATTMLVLTSALAATLLVGTAHFFYGWW